MPKKVVKMFKKQKKKKLKAKATQERLFRKDFP